MSPPAPPTIPLSKLLCDLIDAKATARILLLRGEFDSPDLTAAENTITEVCAQIDEAYPAAGFTPPPSPMPAFGLSGQDSAQM